MTLANSSAAAGHADALEQVEDLVRGGSIADGNDVYGGPKGKCAMCGAKAPNGQKLKGCNGCGLKIRSPDPGVHPRTARAVVGRGDDDDEPNEDDIEDESEMEFEMEDDGKNGEEREGKKVEEDDDGNGEEQKGKEGKEEGEVEDDGENGEERQGKEGKEEKDKGQKKKRKGRIEGDQGIENSRGKKRLPAGPDVGIELVLGAGAHLTSFNAMIGSF